jgi:superkiller protein 3
MALAGLGRLDEAIVHFRNALEINSNAVEVHENLALALAGTGKLDEAVTSFQRIVEIKPDSAEAHNNLGLALFETGRPDEAVAQFQKTLAIDPGFTEAHFHLGSAFYQQGKAAEALAEWRAVLRADPNQLQVLDQMAWLLATDPRESVRNGAESVELAERAVRLSGGQNPSILDTLAAAYAEVGRFPEALQTVRRALGLATTAEHRPLAQVLKTRIPLYEAGTPLRVRTGR